MRKCDYGYRISGVRWNFNYKYEKGRTLRMSERVKVPFTRKNKLSQFPRYLHPKIYNSHYELFDTNDRGNPLDELKKVILVRYVDENSCKISNCFICKKYVNITSLAQREKILRVMKRKIIIEKRGKERKLRYESLQSKLNDFPRVYGSLI